MFEERRLFANNGWLPQQLSPVDGSGQANVPAQLFQAATSLLPTVGLGSTAVSTPRCHRLQRQRRLLPVALAGRVLRRQRQPLHLPGSGRRPSNDSWVRLAVAWLGFSFLYP
jgi:hypothetical protein